MSAGVGSPALSLFLTLAIKGMLLSSWPWKSSDWFNKHQWLWVRRTLKGRAVYHFSVLEKKKRAVVKTSTTWRMVATLFDLWEGQCKYLKNQKKQHIPLTVQAGVRLDRAARRWPAVGAPHPPRSHTRSGYLLATVAPLAEAPAPLREVKQTHPLGPPTEEVLEWAVKSDCVSVANCGYVAHWVGCEKEKINKEQ